MFLRLDGISIHLSSDTPALNAHWAERFGGWLTTAEDSGDEQLSLHLDIRSDLPPLPDVSPLYVDEQQRVIVYEPRPGRFDLRFPVGAHVQVSVSEDGVPAARGVISPRLLGSPQLTDVLYTSLSPLLRRRRFFLLHAAAVRSKAGKAALFVGPSQSGKTTSSLTLFLDGWPYLGSDVVLLSEGEDGVYAYPTPGEVHVRPYTFTLLPRLKRYTNQVVPDRDICLTLPLSEWAEPAPVAAMYFPEVANEPRSRLSALPQAVALARLVEESADRWDSAYLRPHLQFLGALVRQASSHRLQLARDVIDLPQLIDGSDY